ncbi:MAG TPA: hypothetical protein VK708_16460 [Bryobacteraceae bacterium]|jgi:hypothetical protein|nr:hypothetical protein [Bryobacteraceae bacterium]
MFERNVDVFGVLFIALAMLGFAEVRNWHVAEVLDSIHVGNAIDVERCPTSRQVWSNVSAIFH